MKSFSIFCNFCLLLSMSLVPTNTDDNYLNSLLSYSPKNGWINDPNGLVYVNGTYQLFYQYSPGSYQPENICWGHAVSSDLVDWKDKGVAIPYNATTTEEIFSGSAVYDRKNTSGFGKASSAPPIVAIYTSNYQENSTFPNGSPVTKGTQSQSLAYSLDNGETWNTYHENPVIPHPPPQYSDEYQNFRDPKVFWYEPNGKWVMVNVLSKLKKALFYSSTDLKDWTYMSEFSSENGPADVIWECPDLYKMKVFNQNESKWVLTLNIQPTIVASGNESMRYFVGHFNGTKFIEDENITATFQLVDHGSDFYAGVTWNNVGSRRLLIGWVDNWAYARNITDKYRGGLSLVREVFLKKKGNEYKLIQRPNKYIYNYVKEVHNYTKAGVENGIAITRNNSYNFIFNMKLKLVQKTNLSLVILDNQENVEAKMHYNNENKIIYIEQKSMDPSADGKLVKDKAKIERGSEILLNMFVDGNTLTLFCNNGETVFTELLISESDRTLKLREGSDYDVNVTQFLFARS